MPPAARSARLHAGMAAALTAGLAAVGCAPSAAQRPSAPATAAPDEGDGAALCRLRESAARELRRPSEDARAAPAPPGVDPAAIAPIPDDEARARATLADALEALSPAPAAREGGARATSEAARAYVSGRSRLFAGDLEGAERDLREAASMDPGAAEPWREIAEIRLTRGDRAGAVAAFTEALQRDPLEVRSLEALGRVAAQRRDDARAVELLGRVWRLRDGQDAALQYVVAQDMGVALHRLGWLAAGNEALRRAASVPDPFPGATRYARELAAVQRARPDTWREIGDAELRLGRPDAAVDALRAAHDPSTGPTPSALLARTVAARMRQGAPLAAGAALIETVRASGGLASETDIALLRHVAAHSDAGPLLARAIAELRAATSPGDPGAEALASGLVRAEAAALPDAQAVAALRAWAARVPTDDAALRDLLARAPGGDAGALREAIALVEAAPLQERRIAIALLERVPASDALGAWPEVPSGQRGGPAGRLVWARLASAVGDTSRAEREYDELLSRWPGWAPALLASAEFLVQMGRVEEAMARLAAHDETASDDARYAETLVLQAAQRYEQALAMVLPLAQRADGAAPRWEHAMRAGELSLAAGDFEGAERWFRVVVEVAPHREEGHAGLLALYGGQTPLRNEARANEVLRALREAAPESRTLRRLLGRELLQRGQAERAAREMLDLAEQDPADRQALALLVSAWLASGQAERAEAWLREKAERRPEDAGLAVELARVLTETGRPEEAASALRLRLETRPSDAELSRSLESALRATGRDDEADAFASARLARSPRTLETAIESAEVRVRRGEAALAVETLAGALEGRPTLRPDQAERLARLGLSVTQDAVADARPTRPRDEGLLRLLDLIVERAAPLPQELHARRIVLLSGWGEPAERVAAACALGAAQRPDWGSQAHLLALDAMLAVGRQSDAVAVARASVMDAPGGRPVRPELGAAWLLVSAMAGDAAGAETALRVVAEDNRAAETQLALERVRPGLDIVEATPAELTYAIAGLFGVRDLDDDADRLYRLALEFDPRHAWSNNNLGYRMLERGENLPEAYRLVRTAYEEAPDEPAILDSMGWALYKLGVLDDVRNADGRVVQEGAVALLHRASLMRMAGDYGEVLDHLGDALWASGRKDEALDAWRRALALSRDVLQAEAGRAAARAALLGRVRALSEALQQKISAGSGLAGPGVEPAISPILGDGTIPDVPRTPPKGEDRPPSGVAA